MAKSAKVMNHRLTLISGDAESSNPSYPIQQDEPDPIVWILEKIEKWKEKERLEDNPSCDDQTVNKSSFEPDDESEEKEPTMKSENSKADTKIDKKVIPIKSGGLRARAKMPGDYAFDKALWNKTDEEREVILKRFIDTLLE